MALARWLKQAIAAVCCTALLLAQYPMQASAQQPSEDSLIAYDAILEQMRQMNRVVAYMSDQLDRSVYESDALAEALGQDPQAFFDFLQNNIGVQSYTGALRGADGVLIHRSGNTLDRSLLLARLLNHAGYEARLARAELGEDLAGEIAMRTLEPQPRAHIRW